MLACDAPKMDAGVAPPKPETFVVGVVCVVEMLNAGLLFSLSTAVEFNFSKIP